MIDLYIHLVSIIGLISSKANSDKAVSVLEAIVVDFVALIVSRSNESSFQITGWTSMIPGAPHSLCINTAAVFNTVFDHVFNSVADLAASWSHAVILPTHHIWLKGFLGSKRY